MAKDLESIGDIRSHARRLLRRADAMEVLPTPVDRLVEIAELAQAVDWMFSDSKLALASDEVRKILRGARRKIRGTLDRKERVIFVDPSIDGTARGRFVQCHETIHHVLPWQREQMVLADTDATLAPSIESLFEREANQGAAELLFQLDFFERIARDYPTALTTPVELSAMFGGSIHASIRRWAEGHAHALCVLVLDPSPTGSDPLRFKRKYTIESASWMAQFGPSRFRSSVSAQSMPFLPQLTHPLMIDTEATWQLPGIDGEVRPLLVESFSNSYDLFLMFRVPEKDRLVARRRGRPTIVTSR